MEKYKLENKYNNYDNEDLNIKNIKLSLLEKAVIGFIITMGAVGGIYSVYDFIKSFYEK